MRKMAASHDRMVSMRVQKQELLNKQDNLASLWKLQEYYPVANQFEKILSVMAQIMAMMEWIALSNDEPDDVIDINSEGSEDDEIFYGDPANNDYVDLKNAKGHDLGDNAEEVEAKEEEKNPEKADYCDGEDAELTKKQCKE